MASLISSGNIDDNKNERGANRYIISNNQSALNIMQTFAMLLSVEAPTPETEIKTKNI